MDKAIIVDHLVKNFEVIDKESGLVGVLKSLITPKKKQLRALHKISFAMQPGEIIGLIGPTGSGKTAILKILSGLIYPNSGFVEVLEHDSWERKVEFLKQISFIAGHKTQLRWDLSASEIFELNRTIYEISKRDYEETLNELVAMLGVEKLVNIPVGKLSMSQRTVMELIASLIHKPKVVFLDEITLGLDLVASQKVRDFIYEYNKKYGATIIFATKKLDDLVDLVRRVTVINEGKILFDGALEELFNKFAKEKVIKATFSKEYPIEDFEKIGKVKKLVFPQVIIATPRSTISVAAAELIQNFPIEELTVEEVSVEEMIRKMTS